MNKNKKIGIILMAPLILLIIGLLGFISILIISTEPVSVLGVVIVLLFIYGVKLFTER